MINKFNVRFYLKSFDFFILNKICYKLIDFAKLYKVSFAGPIYLPTKKKLYNILKSPHVNKDSRDQLEISSFKRFIDFFFIENYIFFLVKDIYLSFNIDFYFKII